MAPHNTDEHDQDQHRTPDTAQTPEVSRRAFLKTVGAAGAAGGVVAQGVTLEAQSQGRPAQTPARETANAAPVERPYMRIRQEVAENLVKRGIVEIDPRPLPPGTPASITCSRDLL